ncbi:O-antigen ligase [Desulfuromusa kysingii]|uniref:O-antigen ligase n=2 Tax=Desulfuromusa kysingii TaxID=37625 RepID=A0A1H3YGE6_9BACT|nr:O-antigen ligase [Desulfuromusa kysingii]
MISSLKFNPTKGNLEKLIRDIVLIIKFKKKKKEVFSFFLFSLLLFWFLTFPTQGALYQITIYSIPLLCILNSECRTVFKKLLSDNKWLLIVLTVPVLLAYVNHSFSHVTAAYLFEASETVLRYYVRFILLGLCGAVIVDYLGLNPLMLLGGVLISVSIHCGYAIFTSFSEIVTFLFSLKGVPRMSGLIGSPNEFGLLMVIGVLISLGLISKKQNLYINLLLVLVFLCCLLTTILSQSRGAWFALFVGFVLFLLPDKHNVYRPYQRLFFVIVTILICVCSFYQVDLLSKRMSRFTSDPARLLIWDHFFSVWLNHFWVGVYSLDGYFLRTVHGRVFHNPHSVFLDAAVRAGILGLISLGSFFVCGFKKFWASTCRINILPFIGSVFAGGMFSWSIYGKTFYQSVMAVVLMLFLIRKSKSAVDENIPIVNLTEFFCPRHVK